MRLHSTFRAYLHKTLSHVGMCVTYRRILGWVIRFIDTLYSPLGNTGNYSTIADLYTAQFTAADTKVLGLH
jgi:hypothetical protein